MGSLRTGGDVPGYPEEDKGGRGTCWVIGCNNPNTKDYNFCKDHKRVIPIYPEKPLVYKRPDGKVFAKIRKHPMRPDSKTAIDYAKILVWEKWNGHIYCSHCDSEVDPNSNNKGFGYFEGGEPRFACGSCVTKRQYINYSNALEVVAGNIKYVIKVDGDIFREIKEIKRWKNLNVHRLSSTEDKGLYYPR
jgi:transposase-like protein